MLNGKIALVTGASSGIGRVIANKLAGLGAKVAVNYIDIADIKADAEATVAEIKAAGGEAAALLPTFERRVGQCHDKRDRRYFRSCGYTC